MIAFDIDGVVANSFPLIVEEIYKDTGIILEKPEGSTWKIDIPRYNPFKAIRRALMRWEEISSFPDAKEILPKIYVERKEPILFITSRLIIEKDITEKWLEKNFPEIDFEVIFSENKIIPIFFKGVEIFVEDRLKTANFLAPHLRKMFLVDRPYNSRRFTDPRVCRIKSLLEIFE